MGQAERRRGERRKASRSTASKKAILQMCAAIPVPAFLNNDEGEGWGAICEGCGFIVVDNDGNCISDDCQMHGKARGGKDGS